MELRDYQEEAIRAVQDALNGNDQRPGERRPIVCIPTGGGKTIIINTLIKRILVARPNDWIVAVTHTQELVDQSSKDWEAISGQPSNVYSASLKRKQIGQVTFAQIQSIYKKAHLFQPPHGTICLVLVDEADRIPPDGAGQYRTFMSGVESINPDVRVVGFTATPYRMSTGLVYGEGQPFTSLAYDASIARLIQDGHLCRLVGKGISRPDLSSVHVRNGDYVESELESILATDDVVRKSCDELMLYGVAREAWLIFTAGLKHAKMISDELTKRGIEAPIIEGNTPDAERKALIKRFRNRDLRCLVNINVLSVGFNAPHVDMIALMRPTLSPGLYYQQCGRGLRIFNGKLNCLILDFAGNIARHGSIDTLNDNIVAKKKKDKPGEAPIKSCPQCKTYVHAAKRECPECGYNFPPPEVVKHSAEADVNSPLATEMMRQVTSMSFRDWPSKDPAKPNSLLVMYQNGGKEVCREWMQVSVAASPAMRARHVKSLLQMLKPEYLEMFKYDSGKLTYVNQGVVYDLVSPNQLVSLFSCFHPPTCIVINPPSRYSKYAAVIRRVYDTT